MPLTLTPYLNFNGQCKEAFEFYQQVLGGKIIMMQTYGESPGGEEGPSEMRDRIIHVRLAVGDAVLMGSDSPPEYYQKAQGIQVALGTNDPAEAERIFNALAEGATVQMPLQQTFWAVRFGMLVNRFGTPWMVNCEQAG